MVCEDPSDFLVDFFRYLISVVHIPQHLYSGSIHDDAVLPIILEISNCEGDSVSLLMSLSN